MNKSWIKIFLYFSLPQKNEISSRWFRKMVKIGLKRILRKVKSVKNIGSRESWPIVFQGYDYSKYSYLHPLKSVLVCSCLHTKSNDFVTCWPWRGCFTGRRSANKSWVSSWGSYKSNFRDDPSLSGLISILPWRIFSQSDFNAWTS